jgi:hypothetical protein
MSPEDPWDLSRAKARKAFVALIKRLPGKDRRFLRAIDAAAREVYGQDVDNEAGVEISQHISRVLISDAITRSICRDDQAGISGVIEEAATRLLDGAADSVIWEQEGGEGVLDLLRRTLAKCLDWKASSKGSKEKT